MGTIKATEKQQILQEKCLQATEKLESYEDHRRLNKESMEQILQVEQKAKQELLDLKQLRHKEQAMVAEWREACENLRRESDKAVSAGRVTTKSQEDASKSFKMLQADSGGKMSKYTPSYFVISPCKMPAIPEEAGKEALDRENRLHDELNMSDLRKEKLERDLQEPIDAMSTFDNEIQQSRVRETQFISLLQDGKTKVEQANDVANHAECTVRKELVLVDKQENVFQQELDMSSERIRKLKQEIMQVDKRQRWLDEVKAICNEDGLRTTSTKCC